MTTTITIHSKKSMPHPAPDVFARLIDPMQHPRWHEAVYAIAPQTRGPIGAGSRWQVDVHYLGRDFQSTLALHEYVRNRSGRFVGTPVGPAEPTFAFTLTPLADRTRVDYSVRVRVHEPMALPVRWLAGQLGQRALDDYLNRVEASLR